jgi:hypothetical protein
MSNEGISGGFWFRQGTQSAASNFEYFDEDGLVIPPRGINNLYNDLYYCRIFYRGYRVFLGKYKTQEEATKIYRAAYDSIEVDENGKEYSEELESWIAGARKTIRDDFAELKDSKRWYIPIREPKKRVKK